MKKWKRKTVFITDFLKLDFLIWLVSVASIDLFIFQCVSSEAAIWVVFLLAREKTLKVHKICQKKKKWKFIRYAEKSLHKKWVFH